MANIWDSMKNEDDQGDQVVCFLNLEFYIPE